MRLGRLDPDSEEERKLREAKLLERQLEVTLEAQSEEPLEPVRRTSKVITERWEQAGA